MNPKLFFLMLIVAFAYHQTHAQKVGLVNKEWIDAMSQNASDTTYIINFWATWCKPCVEELPAFETIQKKYKDEKVKVVLVSCDFKKQLDSRVVPFIKTNGLKSEVVLMNETDPNSWIDRVDSRFSGAIPATLIVNGSKQFRFFKEGELTLTELDTIVSPLTK
ncbi:MAG: TlpA family protein disulfide reductase [Bacteroidia bacterium]|nr:TlpA family protein disulfide reductase [Bacteroidia bacterium]